MLTQVLELGQLAGEMEMYLSLNDCAANIQRTFQLQRSRNRYLVSQQQDATGIERCPCDLHAKVFRRTNGEISGAYGLLGNFAVAH